MRIYAIVIIMIIAFTSGTEVYGQNQPANPDKSKNYVTNKDNVLLDGYDVVTYFTSEDPVKGKKKYSTAYEKVTYYFSSENNRKMFLKSPQKFLPQYGGWCAWGIGEFNGKYAVDPKVFTITEGKLFLFFNDNGAQWGEFKTPWLKDERAAKKKADKNWAKMKKIKK